MNVTDYFNWEKTKKKNLCWSSYNSLQDAIEDCKNLEELFCLWKIAQIYETDPESSFPNFRLAKCPKLSPSDEFMRSFCVDGLLGENGSQDVPVLFICRESNISGNIDNCTLKLEPEDKQIFWLREVVQCKEKDRSDYFPDRESPKAAEKGSQTKYYNCLSKLLDHLKKENLTGKDAELSNCAYLNVNKRGGFTDCDLTCLATYAQRYQLFIQKEIRSIQPKNIVLCGELNSGDLRKTMESIFQACGYQEYWVYPKHPSRYTNAAFDAVKRRVRNGGIWDDAT